MVLKRRLKQARQLRFCARMLSGTKPLLTRRLGRLFLCSRHTRLRLVRLTSAFETKARRPAQHSTAPRTRAGKALCALETGVVRQRFATAVVISRERRRQRSASARSG